MHSHFSDELLRGVRTESGDFGHSDYRVLVLLQRRCHHLVELADVLVQQVQTL